MSGTRTITVRLPSGLVERLTHEAYARRSVRQPVLSRARDELLADILRGRYAGAVQPVAQGDPR